MGLILSTIVAAFDGFYHDMSTTIANVAAAVDVCSPWLRRYCEACSADTQIENRHVLCCTASGFRSAVMPAATIDPVGECDWHQQPHACAGTSWQ